MSLKDIFARKETDEDITQKRISGKIIHLVQDGYGFISTPEVKFTRIFFHWTALENDTLNFLDLRVGMKVEFKLLRVPDKGWRAIKIKVIV